MIFHTTTFPPLLQFLQFCSLRTFSAISCCPFQLLLSYISLHFPKVLLHAASLLQTYASVFPLIPIDALGGNNVDDSWIFRPRDMQEVYEELVSHLSQERRYRDAAEILVTYLKQHEDALSVLCEGKEWRDAMRIAHSIKRLDLIGS